MKIQIILALILAAVSTSRASDTPGLEIVDTRSRPNYGTQERRVFLFTNTFNVNIYPNDWKIKKIQIVRLDENATRIWIHKESDQSVVMVSVSEFADVKEFTYPDYVFFPANDQLRIDATGTGQFLVYIWYSLYD